MSTKIEYADRTWNPVTGCDAVSEGCQNCYARRLAETRLRGRCGYPADNPFRVTFHPNRLRMFKKGVIFVCDMGDLFHRDVSYVARVHVFNCMVESPNATFLLLTKRPDDMRLFIHWWFNHPRANKLTNIIPGVTVENQETADERIWELSKMAEYFPMLWVSAEPLLGPIDWKWPDIDQLVIGCESGPKRRPMDIEWAENLVEQTLDAGVKVFVKQVEVDGKVNHTFDKLPHDLRVRQLVW